MGESYSGSMAYNSCAVVIWGLGVSMWHKDFLVSCPILMRYSTCGLCMS